MKLHSTKNSNNIVSLENAIFNSLPQDNGLYVPNYIPQLSSIFLANIHNYSFQQIALEVANTLIGDDIPKIDLEIIINKAFDFDIPLVSLKDGFYILELFHGPTLAFKDFGARFMALIMEYYLLRSNGKNLTILVATSGDTGSAVAQAFLDIPNVNVFILYPSNKVSNLQEQQLTTIGHNITAVEVDGTFDDCQKIVKEAFLDIELCNRLNLSSANSINIARLIPQSFYYFYAYAQLGKCNKPIVFSVPCGNFGNLCGGILAKKMGLPINKFIVSTNINDVVPIYLRSGIYQPRPSKQTIANAMDVGSPSNFARLIHFYNNDINAMRCDIEAYSYTDKQISRAIANVDTQNNYIVDPHSAIAYLGLVEYMQNHTDINGVILATAHPAKFLDIMSNILNADKICIPKVLSEVLGKEKKSIKIVASYDVFKSFLNEQYND